MTPLFRIIITVRLIPIMPMGAIIRLNTQPITCHEKDRTA